VREGGSLRTGEGVYGEGTATAFSPENISVFAMEMVHFGELWVLKFKIKQMIYNITSQTNNKF
jgi:hypothetical protein